MRTFRLYRKVDDSGVSGTGYVAEGAVFHDGQVCLAFFSDVHSMGIYPSIEDLIAIHGHGGHTEVVWDDDLEVTKQALMDILTADETSTLPGALAIARHALACIEKSA